MQLEKHKNVEKARLMIQQAAEEKADVIVLPEAFLWNYSRYATEENAEPIDGFETDETATATRMLSQAAKEHKAYIIGGSIPEKRDGAVYNTWPWFDTDGQLKTKYTKCHLFDVDIPGKVSIKESKFYAPGDDYGVFDTEFWRFGIGIWYDARFPDYSQALCRDLKAEFLVFPSIFTVPTGELHWDILRKIRALDNQAFFAFCSSAR